MQDLLKRKVMIVAENARTLIVETAATVLEIEAATVLDSASIANLTETIKRIDVVERF